MGICPTGMKREHQGSSSVPCEVSDNLGKEKDVVSQDFFLYFYSEDVLSSTPTENNTRFENSGFERLSPKWETKAPGKLKPRDRTQLQSLS